MKKHFLLIIAIALFVAFAFSSCDTATGQGAGWGAVTGAVLGAAATGDARGAAVGALIGAHTGATIGAMIELDERGYYDGHPRDYYPYARPTDTRGVVQSPYPPHALVDVRGIPHGALVRDSTSGRVFRKP